MSIAIAIIHSKILHNEDQIRDSPLPSTSSSYYPSSRRCRSCSLPSLHNSLPQTFVHKSLQQYLYQPPTLCPLDKAPILHHPSITASPGLDTEQAALSDHRPSYTSNHLIGPNPFANCEISTSHSASIEDWVNKTLLDASSSTLAKALERVPPFT